MSLAGFTILCDCLSTTKTDTVLFFWSYLTSSKLNISPCSCASLEMAFARWSKSSTLTWIFGGTVQLFSVFSFSWSGAFLGNGDFILSVGGAFLSGEGGFPLRDFCGDLSFWSGGGAFLKEGDLFFFF